MPTEAQIEAGASAIRNGLKDGTLFIGGSGYEDIYPGGWKIDIEGVIDLSDIASAAITAAEDVRWKTVPDDAAEVFAMNRDGKP